MEKQHRGKKERIALLFLALLLLGQACTYLFFGMKKADFHHDEIYTYTLSNDYEAGFFQMDDALLDAWHAPDYFINRLTPGSHPFAYASVYHNQERDVHPPLYYVLFHTVNSFFPQTFSKWIGIGINMALLLLCTVLLYALFVKATGKRSWGLLLCLFWSIGIGTVGMAVFIRMYSLMTLFVLLFALLHRRLLVGEGGKGTLAALGITLFCGFLTQYYFIIFTFFLAACFTLRYAFGRQWKKAFAYAGTVLASLGASFLAFPAMFRHLFWSYRGKEALESASGGENHFFGFVQMLNRDLFGGGGLLVLGVLALLALAGYVVRRKGKVQAATAGQESTFVGCLALCALCYVAVVSQIAPYQVSRYMICVYPLVLFCVFYALYRASCFLGKRQGMACAGTALLFALLTCGAYRGASVPYLNNANAERLPYVQAQAPMAAVMLLQGEEDVWTVTKTAYDALHYDATYITTREDLAMLAIEGLQERAFMLYLPSDMAAWRKEALLARLGQEHTLRATFADESFETYCFVGEK